MCGEVLEHFERLLEDIETYFYIKIEYALLSTFIISYLVDIIGTQCIIIMTL